MKLAQALPKDCNSSMTVYHVLHAGGATYGSSQKVLAHRRDTAANFGNGGEVDNLLREAKSRKEGRRTSDTAAARMDTELVILYGYY
jgi:AAA lid domain